MLVQALTPKPRFIQNPILRIDSHSRRVSTFDTDDQNERVSYFASSFKSHHALELFSVVRGSAVRIDVPIFFIFAGSD